MQLEHAMGELVRSTHSIYLQPSLHSSSSTITKEIQLTSTAFHKQSDDLEVPVPHSIVQGCHVVMVLFVQFLLVLSNKNEMTLD